jgi:hypothetical protein
MCGDCIAGALYTEITPQLTRRLAAALGAYLAEHDGIEAPAMLGDDGRAPSAALAAAACEGLRWSGCHVVELGAISSPMVEMVVRQTSAAGAVFVGNQPSALGTAGLKFWGGNGKRLSAGSGLEKLMQLAEQPLYRSGRKYGTLSRLSMDDNYISGLRPYFHALRPLRLVIDCRCGPVWRHLTSLTAATACELIPLSSRHTPCAVTGDGTRNVPAANSPSPGTPGEGRGEGASAGAQLLVSTPAPPYPLPQGERISSLLARRILAEHAHAGLWIDGNGELLALLDEAGRAVPPERFAAAITPLAAAASPADALHSFALLLTLLSQSDRPVSEVFAG